MSIILISLFVVLALLVSPRINARVEASPLYEADSEVYLQINNSHYLPLNQLMVLFTTYGREVVWAVSGVSLFLFGGWSGKKAAIVMAITIIVLVPISIVAKESVGRIRPTIPDNDFLIAADKEFSFPSGHAIIVSAGAAVLLVLFRDSRRKLIVSVGLAVEAALVCFSRVYVGGHFPLDVIGAVLLGVGVAFVFVSESKHIDRFLQPIARVMKR